MTRIWGIKRRLVARWLIAALVFSTLHPAVAAGLAVARDEGLVQICTGAGMAWVRVAPAKSDSTARDRAPASGDLAQDFSAGGPPAGDEAASAGSPCPFCLGAALAAGGSGDAGTVCAWPQASQGLPDLAQPVPPSVRRILDAPTRGPPPTQRSA